MVLNMWVTTSLGSAKTIRFDAADGQKLDTGNSKERSMKGKNRKGVMCKRFSLKEATNYTLDVLSTQNLWNIQVEVCF